MFTLFWGQGDEKREEDKKKRGDFYLIYSFDNHILFLFLFLRGATVNLHSL